MATSSSAKLAGDAASDSMETGFSVSSNISSSCISYSYSQNQYLWVICDLLT